jgi:hypothetical protein
MATPQQATRKWASRLKGATQEIREGVERVTESPMDKAADKADKYLEGVQNAVSSGKFADRLRATPLSTWKDNTLNKGIGRIAAGVDAAEGKVETFFGELLPFQERLANQVDSMPDVTLDDSIQRMISWTRGMSEFRRG